MKKLVLALGLAAFVAVGASAVENEVAPGVGGSGSMADGTFPIMATIDLEAQTSGNVYSVGVGYDGNFWVSTGDQATGFCEFYLYDEYGTLLDNVQQGGGATGWGHRDMCYDGEFMFGSYSNLVDGFGPDMGYAGYFVGAISPNRALATDGDYFYTCGFGEYLYRMSWDGNFGSAAFPEIISAATFASCYGLAYDGNDDVLYMTFSSSGGPGDIYQISPDGVTLNIFSTEPEYLQHGGCTMACTAQFGDILCILMQDTPDVLVMYDLGHGPSPINDGSWGSIKAMYR
jgi:hypothetical protein